MSEILVCGWYLWTNKTKCSIQRGKNGVWYTIGIKDSLKSHFLNCMVYKVVYRKSGINELYEKSLTKLYYDLFLLWTSSELEGDSYPLNWSWFSCLTFSIWFWNLLDFLQRTLHWERGGIWFSRFNMTRRCRMFQLFSLLKWFLWH